MSESIWQEWVGDQSPAVFLGEVDRGVAAGQFASRREAFIGHARRALRVLFPDNDTDSWTPETLADALLAYAEEYEQGVCL